MPNVSAYILIRTLPGKEKDVLKALDEKLKTKHKELVFGGYDIVIRMSAERNEDIQKIVMENIKPHTDVAGVLVLTCIRMPEK